MTYPQTVTFKTSGFYVACAPEAGAWSFGVCFEEAANGLTEQLHSTEPKADLKKLATKGNGYAVR